MAGRRTKAPLLPGAHSDEGKDSRADLYSVGANAPLSHLALLWAWLLSMLIHAVEPHFWKRDFRETGKEKKINTCETETLISCLPYAPLLGIKPSTSWCLGRCCSPRSYPAQAVQSCF